MKVLLTGASGFVGQHAQMMLDCVLPENGDSRFPILDQQTLLQTIKVLQFDAVIHLAAQTHVPTACKYPGETYQTNFVGTLNLLQALEAVGFQGPLLYVSSGDVYGLQDKVPLVESLIVKPQNPYAASKFAAETLCYQWSQTSKMRIMIARPFNHIGPGQSTRFAIADFACQIIKAKINQEIARLVAGEVATMRDFTDVRDIVRAYELLLERGKNGEIYNICSGKSHVLKDTITLLADTAGVKVVLEVEKERFRSIDQREVYASSVKIQQALSWRPSIAFEQTLTDILRDWEDRLLEAEIA